MTSESGINNYSAYTSYDVGVKPKDKAEVDKTSAEKTQSKTYGSARDYKKYLTEKYDCLRSKEYGVKINSSLLSKAMGDEKTKEWLEENLSAIPSAVEKSQILYDFTHMWKIKITRTNKQTRRHRE